MIENVVVKSSDWRESDLNFIFGDEDIHFTDEESIPNLLKELGIFKSTSEAIRAGRKGKIPFGFTDNFKASKKNRLWIWNPVNNEGDVCE